MRSLPWISAFAMFTLACGGVVTGPSPFDAAADATAGDSGFDAPGPDAAPDAQPDAPRDARPDAHAGCTMPTSPMACAKPCPSGTACLMLGGPLTREYGCVALPASCNGKATCACMQDCYCPNWGSGMNTCHEVNGGIDCENGAISRREFKTDIAYVSDAERAELAREALSMSLATYRYKSQAEGDKRHLGFIIDDQPEPSPAVQADRTHVDEYGYTSMLLATVQEQQRQIDALKKQLERLETSRGLLRRGLPSAAAKQRD